MGELATPIRQLTRVEDKIHAMLISRHTDWEVGIPKHRNNRKFWSCVKIQLRYPCYSGLIVAVDNAKMIVYTTTSSIRFVIKPKELSCTSDSVVTEERLLDSQS